MNQPSHKALLRSAVLMAHAQRQTRATPLTWRRTWIGITSLASTGAIAAAIFVALTTTSQVTTLQPVTAETLLADARSQLQQITDLQPGQVYTLTVKEVKTVLGEEYTADPQTGALTPAPIPSSTTQEQYWTDGKQYRQDSTSTDETGTKTESVLWVLDNATSGTAYAALSVDLPKEKQTSLSRRIITETFHDYPASGSILDTSAALNDIIKLTDVDIVPEQTLSQDHNIDIVVSGQEDLDGVPTYRLTGHQLLADAINPLDTAAELQDAIVTRTYWIGQSDHRLIKETTIVPDYAQYDRYYDQSEIIVDDHALDLSTWKTMVGMTDQNQVLAEGDGSIIARGQLHNMATQLTSFRQPLKASCESEDDDITIATCQHDRAVRQAATTAWHSCVAQTHDLNQCNDALLSKLHESETFLAFCTLADSLDSCQQTYTDFAATGFDSEAYRKQVEK